MDVEVRVSLTHTIDRQRIEDLLVGAFEGGSNYLVHRALPVEEGVKFYDAVFGSGLRVWIYDESHSRLLNRTAIENGLHLMAAQYPRHMADVINGNDDATTADVWLQLCLFGEVVYG